MGLTESKNVKKSIASSLSMLSALGKLFVNALNWNQEVPGPVEWDDLAERAVWAYVWYDCFTRLLTQLENRTLRMITYLIINFSMDSSQAGSDTARYTV